MFKLNLHVRFQIDRTEGGGVFPQVPGICWLGFLVVTVGGGVVRQFVLIYVNVLG